jgi:hypothetical protein
VKVRVVELFNAIDDTPNCLPIVGGATTVTLAFEVLPVNPVAETCTLLFFHA